MILEDTKRKDNFVHVSMAVQNKIQQRNTM